MKFPYLQSSCSKIWNSKRDTAVLTPKARVLTKPHVIRDIAFIEIDRHTDDFRDGLLVLGELSDGISGM